ncbi:MAG TPA: SRPBCC family protein [Acidimicrobiia bacterium]|nr:SRPBCC family protein [Acidimicrobiia bacterium]
MARNECTVPVPADVVWDVLADPRTYGYFVAGSKRVRTFDPDWPESGTEFRHAFGVGPLHFRDATWVVGCEPPRELRLRTGLRPFGIADVRFEIEPLDESTTRVVLEERPIRGPLARVWNPVFDRLMHARNAETLRRFTRAAARRAEVRAAGKTA